MKLEPIQAFYVNEVEELPRVEEGPPLRVFHQIVDEEADHVDREEHQRVRHQLKGKRRRLCSTLARCYVIFIVLFCSEGEKTR